MHIPLETEDELEFGGHSDAEGMALAKAIDATWLKTRHSSFADRVREFKAVEAEFVKRAGDDEYFALETRRRVAEALLREAHGSKPFETCQNLWNDLLRLGFTNLERRCRMTWFYADSCRINQEPEAGLSVLEPLIAELDRLLADLSVTKHEAAYYRRELNSFGQLSAKLKVQQGLPVEIPPDIPEVAFNKALSRACEKTGESSFDDQVREYKAIEAEFLQRVGDDASLVLEIKQGATEAILSAARDTAQPFEACRDLYNEMLRLGLRESGYELMATSCYAECCLQNEQSEAGIAALEPLIAEIKRRLRDPKITKDSAWSYRGDLRELRQLLSELKAQQGKP